MFATLANRANVARSVLLAHLIRHRFFYYVSLPIVVYGCILVPLFRYQINPDGIAYISLAQKYAQGDIRHAINGYWGPLLPWLLAPGIKLGVPAILFIKIIQLAVVVILMITTYRLVLFLVKKQWPAVFAVSLVGTAALKWAFVGPLTPDLILCALLLLLTYALIQAAARPSLRRFMLIGVLGALMFFAKSVGIYLFVATMGLWTVVQHVQLRNWRIRINWSGVRLVILSGISCGILIAPFVAAISIKYQRPTLGTSGSYNFSLVGPHTQGHVMAQTLIPPPNPSAISIWEDISRIPVRTWSPIRGAQNRLFFRDLVYKNIMQAVGLLRSGVWFLLPLSLVYFLTRDRQSRTNKHKALLVGISLLTIAAYVPMFVEDRYIYYAFIMAMIGFCCFLAQLKRQQYIFLVCALLAGCISIAQSVSGLHTWAYLDKQIYSESTSLAPYIDHRHALASDTFNAINVCHYTRARCMGVVHPPSPDLGPHLRQYHVDRLLLLPSSAKTIQEHGVKLQLIRGTHYDNRALYRVL